MRVAIVEGHDIVREGLVALLMGHAEVEIAWQATTSREALERARLDAPDVVLMDVIMPDLGGIEATRLLRRECPETRVLALSARRDHSLIAGMLRAGASGYLVKSNAIEELFQSLEAVGRGEVHLGEGATAEAIQDYVRQLRNGGVVQEDELSPREREVLQMIAEGCTTKEIAARLSVSIQTVATHRRRIMEKTHCESIADLTKFAIRSGVTPLD